MFLPATIERFFAHFQELTQSILQQPEHRLAQLQFLPAAEKHQLLVTWNTNRCDYSRDECIHTLFGAPAAKFPENIAIAFADQTLTYAALDCKTNQLANYLIKHGVVPHSQVAVCVRRTPDCYAL